MKNINQKSFEYFQIVFPKIVEIIRLLAAPCETQISLFPQNIEVTDEICDFVDEALIYTKILVENKFLEMSFLIKLKEIEKSLQSFEDIEWNLSSLKKSKQWEKLRSDANDFLYDFSTDYATPNLYWIKKHNK